MTTSHQEQSSSPHGEDGAPQPHERGFLRSIWENNKGACLVLLAELFGSSSDAVARHLQQGPTGFHTLQVSDRQPHGR